MNNSRLVLAFVILLAFIGGLIAAPFSYFRETQQLQLQQHTFLLATAPLLNHRHDNNGHAQQLLSSRNDNIRTKTQKAILGKRPPRGSTVDGRLLSSAPLTPLQLQAVPDELTAWKKAPNASPFYYDPNILDGDENENYQRVNSGRIREEVSAKGARGRTGSSSSSSSSSPAFFENTLADFSSHGGRWAVCPNNSQGEPVRHWIPNQKKRRSMIRGSGIGDSDGLFFGERSAKHSRGSQKNDELIMTNVEEPYESVLRLGPQNKHNDKMENISKSENGEPLVSSSSSLSPPRPFLRPWLRFDQIDALRCLSGRRIVFIGNSNTRTLMTAFQSLLEGIPQMSRVSAKQQCDNSKYNHSCWLVINHNGGVGRKIHSGETRDQAADSNGHGANITSSLARALRERRRRQQSTVVAKENEKGGKRNDEDAEQNLEQRDFKISQRFISQVRPIHLHYVSYTNGLYHPELEERVAKPFFSEEQEGTADIVVMNVGLNFLQKMWDDVWRKEHEESAPHLRAFIRRYLLTDGFSSRVKSESSDANNNGINKRVFFWHTTTPLCRAMPHFRRYKYRKFNWQSRSLESTNAAIDESNRFVVENVLKKLANHEGEGGTDAKEGDVPKTYTHRNGDRRKGAPAAKTRRYTDRLVLVDGHAMLSPADLTTPNALEKAKAVKMERNGDGETRLASAEMTDIIPLRGTLDDVCNIYDDPLHHRFFDRELVQVILNNYC